MKEELNVLKNMVRVGTVSSVDIKNRTARVKFTDKNNLISGPLKILKNLSFISVEDTALTYKVQEAEGHTHEGKTEEHSHKVIISPWMPSIGELVLCIYLPNGGSDGFVIGGI